MAYQSIFSSTKKPAAPSAPASSGSYRSIFAKPEPVAPAVTKVTAPQTPVATPTSPGPRKSLLTPATPAPVTPSSPSYVSIKTQKRIANLTDQSLGGPTYISAPGQAPAPTGPSSDSLDVWLHDLRHANDVQTNNPITNLKNKIVSTFGHAVSSAAASALSLQEGANRANELAQSPDPQKKAAGALGMISTVANVAFLAPTVALEATHLLPGGDTVKKSIDTNMQGAFSYAQDFAHAFTVKANLDPTLTENVDQVAALGLIVFGGHMLFGGSSKAPRENALSELRKNPDQIATQVPQTLHDVLGLTLEKNADGTIKPKTIDQLDTALKKTQKVIAKESAPEDRSLNQKIAQTAYQTLKDYAIDQERGQAKIDTIVNTAKDVVEQSKESAPSSAEPAGNTPKKVEPKPVYRIETPQSKNGDVYYSNTREIPKARNPFKEIKTEEIKPKNPVTIDVTPEQFADPKFEQPHLQHARQNGNDFVIFRVADQNSPLNGKEMYVKVNRQKESGVAKSLEAKAEETIKSPGVEGSRASKKLQSAVFERLSKENPDLTEGPTYKPQDLKENIRKAVNLVEKDKNKAYRIAMGLEEAPKDQTSTAVNIALAEKALKDGNRELYADLVRNRSLAQTRRGQEIVAEKGSVSDNSTSRYVKELVNLRLTKLGENYLSSLPEKLKKKGKSKAIEVLDKEVAKTKKAIESKGTLNLGEVQNFLDSLTCK